MCENPYFLTDLGPFNHFPRPVQTFLFSSCDFTGNKEKVLVLFQSRVTQASGPPNAAAAAAAATSATRCHTSALCSLKKDL